MANLIIIINVTVNHVKDTIENDFNNTNTAADALGKQKSVWLSNTNSFEKKFKYFYLFFFKYVLQKHL